MTIVETIPIVVAGVAVDVAVMTGIAAIARCACRVWYERRPPGRQPRATSYDRLYGRVPYRAFILYNGSAWDADYDWYGYERRYRGSVPRVIVQITAYRRDVRR